MDEFSLESLSERIYKYKSKEYFEEIISSYTNHNYRSATVMLWSVAIIDLVFKLTDLVDLHEDKTAESLLKEISDIQANDRKSSKWEHKLVTEVAKRTNLLSSDNISFLEYLYQQRNLSAHPVLDSNLELHRPNKDTVRALIVNCVDGILSKPPFFSKDIVGTIALDLEASKSYLENDTEKLKHYLESRFFSQMTEKVELEVFKSLWKFVFKLENDKAFSNRSINFDTLTYLYNKHKLKSLELISNEKNYFSDISKDPKVVFYLIRFLSKHTDVYKKMKNSAKIIIDDRVEEREREFYYSNFQYKNLSEFHMELLKYIVESEGNISKRILSHLSTLSDSPEWSSKVNILRNAYYGKSGTFDIADNRYGQFISPYLSKYAEEEMLDLLSRVNTNNQIYGRDFNKHINKRVKETADRLLGECFDYSIFPNFLRAVR